MFKPGDVVKSDTDLTVYRKYMLCVGLDNHFFYINSPKQKTYPGDFVVPCGDLPFIDPTPSGNSIISCNLVISKNRSQLIADGAVLLGRISHQLIQDLLIFVDASAALSEEDKEKVVDGLGEWA